MVAPTSLLGTWERECQKFAPTTPVHRYNGTRRDLGELADNAMAVNQDVGKVMQIYTSNFGTEFVREVRAALKAAGYNV